MLLFQTGLAIPPPSLDPMKSALALAAVVSYGDMSCPLKDAAFSAFDIVKLRQSFMRGYFTVGRWSLLERARSAVTLMSAFGSPERVIAAFQSGVFDGRRVVVVGYVTMRQAFISLGCLAGDALINWLGSH